MTYTIERNNDIGPDQHYFIQAISRYLSVFVKPIVFNWSINQDESVKVQLDGGIRFLDLRVAVKLTDGKIYFLHGLYGDEITQHLKSVYDWLVEHPKEVIILDFQHFYNFNSIDHRTLINKLNNIFAEKICPVSPSFDITSLKWLNEKNYQVLIVYRNEISLHYNNLYWSQQWPTPWPETVNPTKLIDRLNEGLRGKSHFSGFVSQGLLTPNLPFIVRHPCGNRCHDLAPICRKAMIQWIEENSPGDGGMNVVITDDVAFDDFQFSKAVIQRNIILL